MKKIACFFILIFTWCVSNGQTIHVGAKHFNEGYIISEIISQLLERNGFTVERHYNLGGTLVCFEALRNDAIDIYPEYTGTIASEILKEKDLQFTQLKELLNTRFDMGVSSPFGFNNTYTLVMNKRLSDSLRIYSIEHLKNRLDLSLGLSYEFLKRQDGWDNLNTFYNLNLHPNGLEHGLAYQALAEGKIQVTDAYSTDGEIPKYNLRVLKDEKNFFPTYEALALYKNGLDDKAKQLLQQLANTISEEQIQQMNASVLYQNKTFEEVASEFLSAKGIGITKQKQQDPILADVIKKIGTHLFLTFFALILAVLVAVPLGIFIYWNPSLSKTILYASGLMQTIPSIALLAIMIPLFGIGVLPAIVALFLYAVLPILRNTVTGLKAVDPLLKKVADGLGMNRIQKLRLVEFPLAMPVILAGIRTAAVINVGTATLAAFIGAGGLGEYIVTGLALNNTGLILRGALPAAGLALLVELGFTLLEQRWVPKHLR